MRRVVVVIVGLLAAGALASAAAAGIPSPDPNFAATVTPSPCVAPAENPYEQEAYADQGWDARGRYPAGCQRLKFSYGPVVVKPGQNDVLIGPVTIEKPAYDGYITRFKPDLVYADGTVPPIEQMHLHHGTWLNITQPYGIDIQFFAAGEEKTIATFPVGYGLPVRGTDTWQLLYMVHSATPKPDAVFITYEVDFVPKQVAESTYGMKAAYSMWLDVRPSGYPVFNVQRPYGGADGECTWPKEECAAHDPWGDVIPGQGAPPPANGGTDRRMPLAGQRFGRHPNFQGGTLVGIGGHLHPGGLRNEIDLVRDGAVRRIFTAEAKYWGREDPSVPNGPPTSWDFSMTVTGLPRWGVRIEPGDILRSNAVYDTVHQSTYENMGIAVAYLAPDLPDGTPSAPGVDPFTVSLDSSANCDSGGLEASPPVLCDKGRVTHGHLAENDNFSGPEGTLDAPLGDPATRVEIAGFAYVPGNFGLVDTMGIPRVPLGGSITFANEDTAAGIYHTITACGYPCSGPTGTSFPLADGRTSAGRSIEFDSSELGFGTPEFGPAKNQLQWTLPVTPESGFASGDVVTYFCRIHPFMRGTFAVD